MSSRIPGVVWGGLMVALPLLSVWLETYLGAYGWAPAVAGLLLIVAKVIEVMRYQEPELPERVAMADWQPTKPKPNVWWG